MSGRRVVAIGGGTGLPRVLSALLAAGEHPTAIVTMADDGGSSGCLRQTYGMLPPGDVRNCLVALAEPGSDLAGLFQYRFVEGEGLAGHPVGNLVLAALTNLTGSFPEAITTASRMLGSRGSVLPSTLSDVVLMADDADGRRIEGQATIAHAQGLKRVFLDPADPPAYPPALAAIADADAVILGPGSLYTSLMPNLLVDGIIAALRSTPARVLYVCNVANQRGETFGMDCADHVAALLDHGMAGIVDAVLVHAGAPSAGGRAQPSADSDPEPVVCGAPERERLGALGVETIAADLVDSADLRHHDVGRLAAALGRVLG